MTKFIVTTTVNEPSMALVEFSRKPGWTLIVVGDKRTPHWCYAQMPGVVYLAPELQEECYKELSNHICWNCIQRRNIGFVEAYLRGADVVASIDDDNIPYSFWGEDLLVGRTVNIEAFSNACGLFEPLSVT